MLHQDRGWPVSSIVRSGEKRSMLTDQIADQTFRSVCGIYKLTMNWNTTSEKEQTLKNKMNEAADMERLSRKVPIPIQSD